MPDLRKISVFGLVGVTSSLIHFVVASAAMYFFESHIFLGNLLGFAVAFVVSYLGHYHWTFRSNANHRAAALRFMATASAGFLVNNMILFILVQSTGRELRIYLIIAIAVAAAAVYVLSNRWAFIDKIGKR